MSQQRELARRLGGALAYVAWWHRDWLAWGLQGCVCRKLEEVQAILDGPGTIQDRMRRAMSDVGRWWLWSEIHCEPAVIRRRLQELSRILTRGKSE